MVDSVLALYLRFPPLFTPVSKVALLNVTFVKFTFVRNELDRFATVSVAPLKSTLSPIMYPSFAALPLRKMYPGRMKALVPIIPPLRTFVKFVFCIRAFVSVRPLKSIPLKSLNDKSTFGPKMYPLRSLNVVSGNTGKTGDATMLPDLMFTKIEFVKMVPVKLVPLKSWFVKSIPLRSTYGPIMYPDNTLYPELGVNVG
jgi:hypothetical protein